MDYVKEKYRPVSLDETYKSKDGRDIISITFDDGLESVYRNAVPELVKRNIPFSIFVPSGYIGKTSRWIKNKVLYKEENVMTAGQLINLSQIEIATIGSHGVRHEGLSGMSEKEAKYEIEQSKTDLEKLLKKEILFFSFPHGKYSREHLQYLMTAGYLKAYSINPELVKSDNFVSGRFSITPDDWRLEQKLKLSGAYRWLSSIASIKN
jgi:peptidoglycan/xylan/chitin deacetylase (PgdA/CDA1 family)